MTFRVILLLSTALAVLSMPSFAAQTKAKEETRDWSAIDTNHDSSISPDEMRKYLKEAWAHQHKKN